MGISKIKILFIAYANSTHTHAWVELLHGEDFDVMVYGVENQRPPASFHVSTLVCSDIFSYSPYSLELEAATLARVILEWQPAIIHTLGLYPASFVYLYARKAHELHRIGRWIVTARGGPDLALQRLIPEEAQRIQAVLAGCDLLVADNIQNYQYALQLGLAAEKLAPIGVVPGAGGVDCGALQRLSTGPPSGRKRLILWPKAYECPASKALPVFEAFRLSWEAIKPCTIFMTAAVQQEVCYWFETLPEEIRQSCVVKERIPRTDLLDLMGKARVLLAPSLTDGIPNSLYEAMAAGAAPIVSPIETITSVFSKENVLFARNLYPEEIARVLTVAMRDDTLVDKLADVNRILVLKLANRSTIRTKVILMYRKMTQ